MNPMRHLSTSGSALPIDDDGNWIEIFERQPSPRGRRSPALFLDRDGVIVEDRGFLYREADVRLVDGAAAVVARANRLGVPVIIVSNQSGIGRGHFDWLAFARVQARIIALFAGEAVSFDAVCACPHHPQAKPPYAHPDAPWRKPNPGMLLKAAVQLDINLAASWIIGDRANDLLAGRRAGLAGGAHLRTKGSQEGERQQAFALGGGHFRVVGISAMLEALDHIPFLSDDRM